jgi:hypothetical protein
VRAVRRDASDVRTMKESLQHIEQLLEANASAAGAARGNGTETPDRAKAANRR